MTILVQSSLSVRLNANNSRRCLLFPQARMSEETLKTWFKFSYDMAYDIFKTTIKHHNRTGTAMTLAKETAATIKVLTFGLETPDPRQGNLEIPGKYFLELDFYKCEKMGSF